MDKRPEIYCVLVRHNNGEEVWTSAAEYYRNPTRGSFIVRDSMLRAPDMVKHESTSAHTVKQEKH